MKKIFKLVHDEARDRAIKFIKESPDGYVVTISEPTRSLDQNALMWELLDKVSKQVEWYGSKLTAEEWKSVFSAALFKEKVVPGLNGGFVVLGQRTSRMSKKDFSELIELIYSFCAERSVNID